MKQLFSTFYRKLEETDMRFECETIDIYLPINTDY